MNYTKRIVKKAAPYTAVAFDVFDTLLKRDVAKPTDLFLLQGKEFAAARIHAEQQARAAAKGEVTLAEIYAQPAMCGYDPAQECAWELAAAVPNLPVREAVQILKEQGKHIYYISDMYLPPEQISAMLSHCGYADFDGGFVSSSYGVQKRSGALFRRFLHETGYKAGEVLFIGDSWRADVCGAALAAMPAWHLPAPRIDAENPVEGALQAFVQNRQAQLSGMGETLGFTVLGALEVAFCQWLHEKRQSHPEGRIFFLARDMYLTRKIYRYLYPEEETFYLEVSRRSLCPILLAQKNLSLAAQALPRQQLTGAQIADYCATVCPTDLAEQVYDLKEDAEKAVSLLSRCKVPEKASAVLDYLKQSGVQSGDLLVDIGSGGTTQFLLESLLQIQLFGLQLSADARLYQRFPKERAEAFLKLDGKETGIYWAGQPILERFLSQDVGATVGYTLTVDGLIVLHEKQKAEPKVQQMQRGAIRFVRAWKDSVLCDLQIPGKLAIRPFLQLIGKPTSDQVSWLGSIRIEDGGLYPLACPRSLGYYLGHLAACKGDFQDARWKIGFLKKLLLVPIPYDRLYLTMKSKSETER